MTSRYFTVALASLVLLAAQPSGAAPAGRAGSSAANDVQEVVVTGSRIRDYDPTETPHVSVLKRADNLLVEIKVGCDTRDKPQRLDEIRATLRNMIRTAAKDPSVKLGLGDEIVGAFDDSMIETLIRPDTKADTSYAILLIKTPVSQSDSFDEASRRLSTFIDRVQKVGRTEVLIQGDWQLSLIGPAQYRAQVVKAVADDARAAAADFGEGYGVKVIGLEHPVQWYRAGPLDLALYIPYRLEIEALRH